MKLTFELVAATDLTTFNELVNSKLAQGYRFVTGHSILITEHTVTRVDHSGITDIGCQYSVAMLLEEEEK